jgi:hypothetical protein
VIKLDPAKEGYDRTVIALQTTARATNKFSADVLDSVKVHQRTAVKEAQDRESPTLAEPIVSRFRLPQPAVESPVTGPPQNQSNQ